MNNKGLSKSVRGGRISAVLTALVIVLVIALNLLLTYFGGAALWLADMTPEGLYTVSDDMKKYTSFINELDNDERKITITFCSDPDVLVSTENTRVPYFLALGLQSIYDRVEVKAVNVQYNPTAVSKYKATSLSTIDATDIIVSYGDRYRVVDAKSFWLNDGEGNLYSFNGEYKLTSIIMSVVAKNRPVAYFVPNHGETYYDASNPSREENAEAEAIRLKSIEVARALGFNITETTVTDGDGVESVRYEIDFTDKTEREVELITEYLKYADYLAKWDGKLPTVMTGDSATVMIPTP